MWLNFGRDDDSRRHFSRNHSDNYSQRLNFGRDEESSRHHFSRNHSDDFSQYWNKKQFVPHRGNHFRGHRNHHSNYNNFQRNNQDFRSSRLFNGQQKSGDHIFKQRNMGNPNLNRINNNENANCERGLRFRPKYQEYLNFRRCQSSLDLRDLDETKLYQRNLNRSVGGNRNSVDREILRNYSSRKIFNRETDLSLRPNNNLSRIKGMSQQNPKDLVIKISGKKENMTKESLSNIQKMTFSSDSSENGDEPPSRQIFLKEHPNDKKCNEEQGELPVSELSSRDEQKARKRKLPDSFEWGDGSDEEFEENDGSGLKFLYTADKLPKYDGKTPVGHEGGLVLQVHCCTYCRVVYKSSKLLQHHFLTKSHYNKYKALLNDTEVLQMFKKC